MSAMYPMMLSIHSGMRWLVLISLIYTIIRAYSGFNKNLEYGKLDGIAKTVTVIMAHLQLIIGFGIYFMSPFVKSILHPVVGINPYNENSIFYAFIHPIAMIGSIVAITIGSAKARRMELDSAKFRVILVWFGIGLFLALVLIPWSFYPIVGRPFIR